MPYHGAMEPMSSAIYPHLSVEHAPRKHGDHYPWLDRAGCRYPDEQVAPTEQVEANYQRERQRQLDEQRNK